MARVNRFIFNSDFMTIAHVGREEVTVTIPAGETPIYSGVKEVEIADMPAGCWPRCKVSYTATNNRTQVTACEGLFVITAYKNGKTINYVCSLSFSEGKMSLWYYVQNATDTSTVLADSQTVTITIDFLKQPNS